MKVGVIMGSVSDYEVMADAVAMLGQFGVDFEKRVVSAHRTPDLLCEYAKTAKNRGIGVIIAGAGGAAHLPGMVASMTTLPRGGRPREVAGPERAGFAAFDRADACGRSGGDDGHQRGEERGADSRVDPRSAGCGAGCPARSVPCETDRRRTGGRTLIRQGRRLWQRKRKRSVSWAAVSWG